MKLPPRLAALVVRDGVSLGLLAEADRAQVLALAAAAIEPGREHREADMNRILESWLEGPGAMLRTDHVELRRWLVDAGFVSRDGFARAYLRGEAETARATALLGEPPAPPWPAPSPTCGRPRPTSARLAARLSPAADRSARRLA
jgi:hypothetical protein